MNWFTQPKPGRNAPILALNDFKAGQIVRHKISGARAVITRFEENPVRGPRASVSIGFEEDDEFWVCVAEIESEPTPTKDEQTLTPKDGETCSTYTRPEGVMGGPCIKCGRVRSEHPVVAS